jgi:hypothetical protein
MILRIVVIACLLHAGLPAAGRTCLRQAAGWRYAARHAIPAPIAV